MGAKPKLWAGEWESWAGKLNYGPVNENMGRKPELWASEWKHGLENKNMGQ